MFSHPRSDHIKIHVLDSLAPFHTISFYEDRNTFVIIEQGDGVFRVYFTYTDKRLFKAIRNQNGFVLVVIYPLVNLIS